ncbi:hypothetical protein G9A89_009981 [Geosiphon pyriformis]|nr:hypothetical protein G9A89_009981 [Geosiphon pyriformis]
MIYTIPEEEEPISSCASESESPINRDSNSDNDDDNNSSSSVQKGNDNDNNSNSDTNSDVNYEQYIALPDLFKEQELKWYSDNGEGRIDVSVNIAEEEIVGQGEIISTGQAISIPPYSQYMLAIERKEKEQEQMFEVEATLCESGEIGLINLHILAKSYSSIKILIYNNTENVISIPEGTTIGYLTTEIEDQPPNPIPDFPQLCGYVDITSQTIYE